MQDKYLESIAKSLAKIADSLAKPAQSEVKLGFGEAPRSSQYLFCNRNNGGVWYSLNEQSQPQVIEHQSLTGYIRKIEFKQVERRREETHKLHVTFEADKIYTLESGSKAHFTKGLLMAIASMTPRQLAQPIMIVPQASTENAEVLFCNIWQNGNQIFSPYNDETDWRAIASEAKELVEEAQGASEEPKSLSLVPTRGAINEDHVAQLMQIATDAGYSLQAIESMLSSKELSLKDLTLKQFQSVKNWFLPERAGHWNAKVQQQNTA